MDESEKESEVEERTEVTVEGIEGREEEEIEERSPIEEAVEEEERCEEDPECHSSGCVQLLLTVRKFPLWNL